MFDFGVVVWSAGKVVFTADERKMMGAVNRSVKTMRDSTKLLTSEGVITLFSIFFFIVISRLLTKIEMSSLAVLGIITGLSAMVTGLGLVTSCIQKAPELLARGGKG